MKLEEWEEKEGVNEEPVRGDEWERWRRKGEEELLETGLS